MKKILAYQSKTGEVKNLTVNTAESGDHEGIFSIRGWLNCQIGHDRLFQLQNNSFNFRLLQMETENDSFSIASQGVVS